MGKIEIIKFELFPSLLVCPNQVQIAISDNCCRDSVMGVSLGSPPRFAIFRRAGPELNQLRLSRGDMQMAAEKSAQRQVILVRLRQ